MLILTSRIIIIVFRCTCLTAMTLLPVGIYLYLSKKT